MIIVVRSCMALSNASFTRRSDSPSKELVASSRSRMGGLFRMARAIATRCFSPPDSCRPCSPTCVLYFSGNFEINSSALASFAAKSISSSVAFGLPYLMLSEMVPEKRTGS
mmetsp:Transcript_36719/g.48379  ORF Transcript_36719/g.48379 Transcript_36719/m.48379 type:complete len:111 (-) Transcript_36719:462-794(-)